MLASQGVRTTIRHVPNLLPNKTGVGTRAIHIPSYIRVQPRIPHPGQTQKLFNQSRHVITQFFNLLTAPGIRVPTPATVGDTLGSVLYRSPTIQQSLPFQVRHSLSRRTQGLFLPRAPNAVPRGIAQVGLGTARNFSSARPIFQNLVENVPVAGRAIYNADLDMKLSRDKHTYRRAAKGSSKKEGGKELLKPRARDFSTKENRQIAKATKRGAELDKYFAAPSVPDFATCLLIPLAPTPTARVPLPENPGSLLPLPTLASIHITHEMHSLRVSSLFSRLDAANVWARGVQCSAFSHGSGAEGVCTMLKVEFIGWRKAEVRSVIGESGTGWCVLEEVQTSKGGAGAFTDSDFDDSMSDASSVLSGMFEDSRSGSQADLTTVGTVDPSQSLILPTLEFSSSFLAATSPSPTPTPQRSHSSLSFVRSDLDFDPWLDAEAPSDDALSGISSGWMDAPSMNGWKQVEA